MDDVIDTNKYLPL